MDLAGSRQRMPKELRDAHKFPSREALRTSIKRLLDRGVILRYSMKEGESVHRTAPYHCPRIHYKLNPWLPRREFKALLTWFYGRFFRPTAAGGAPPRVYICIHKLSVSVASALIGFRSRPAPTPYRARLLLCLGCGALHITYCPGDHRGCERCRGVLSEYPAKRGPPF